MNLIATIFSKKISITFHTPTNEEFNTYADEIAEAVKSENDENLHAVRKKYFDLWAEKITGMAKESIPDRKKSSVMFQTFEVTEITEKN
jgi:hypothetical protein